MIVLTHHRRHQVRMTILILACVTIDAGANALGIHVPFLPVIVGLPVNLVWVWGE